MGARARSAARAQTGPGATGRRARADGKGGLVTRPASKARAAALPVCTSVCRRPSGSRAVVRKRRRTSHPPSWKRGRRGSRRRFGGSGGGSRTPGWKFSTGVVPSLDGRHGGQRSLAAGCSFGGVGGKDQTRRRSGRAADSRESGRFAARIQGAVEGVLDATDPNGVSASRARYRVPSAARTFGRGD